MTFANGSEQKQQGQQDIPVVDLEASQALLGAKNKRGGGTFVSPQKPSNSVNYDEEDESDVEDDSGDYVTLVNPEESSDTSATFSRGIRWLLLLTTVILPVVFTGWGYFVTNQGGEEPDEHQPDENWLEYFLVMLGQFVHEEVDVFTTISILTNLVFTAIPTYMVCQAAMQKKNYTVPNLSLVGSSVILGAAAGMNYIPLLAESNPRFFDNLHISRQETQLAMEFFGHVFTGTMMYLNAISLQSIFTKIGKFWQDINTPTFENAEGRLAAFKSVFLREFPDKMSKASLALSVTLGALYGYQVNKDISDYLGEYLPLWASDLLAHSICGLGNYTFGMFFSNDGFKALASGIHNLFAGQHTVPQRLNQGALAVLCMGWASLTIIPSMSQASPDDPMGLVTMAFSALIFNFPASRGMINSILSALVGDFSGAKDAALGTSEEKNAFNTAVPFASFGNSVCSKLCCPERRGYEQLEDTRIVPNDDEQRAVPEPKKVSLFGGAFHVKSAGDRDSTYSGYSSANQSDTEDPAEYRP